MNGSECDFWVDKFADGELKCNVKRKHVNSTTERSLRWLLIKICINYPLKIPILEDDDFLKINPRLWLCLSMWYWTSCWQWSACAAFCMVEYAKQGKKLLWLENYFEHCFHASSLIENVVICWTATSSAICLYYFNRNKKSIYKA